MKIPTQMFRRERSLINADNATEDQKKAALSKVIEEMVQAEIEWRITCSGNEACGYPSVSPVATIGNVHGGGAGGYSVLDYEAERIRERTPLMYCAQELLSTLTPRQFAAVLLCSYSTRSPRKNTDWIEHHHHSRNITLQGVLLLQRDIAKELVLELPLPFTEIDTIRQASYRARKQLQPLLMSMLSP